MFYIENQTAAFRDCTRTGMCVSRRYCFSIRIDSDQHRRDSIMVMVSFQVKLSEFRPELEYEESDSRITIKALKTRGQDGSRDCSD